MSSLLRLLLLVLWLMVLWLLVLLLLPLHDATTNTGKEPPEPLVVIATTTISIGLQLMCLQLLWRLLLTRLCRRIKEKLQQRIVRGTSSSYSTTQLGSIVRRIRRG